MNSFRYFKIAKLFTGLILVADSHVAQITRFGIFIHVQNQLVLAALHIVASMGCLSLGQEIIRWRLSGFHLITSALLARVNN